MFKIDGNVFLRDEAHAGHEKLPAYNTTSKIDITNIPYIYNVTNIFYTDAGIMFQTQKNSVVSNNIFG